MVKLVVVSLQSCIYVSLCVLNILTSFKTAYSSSIVFINQKNKVNDCLTSSVGFLGRNHHGTGHVWDLKGANLAFR